MSDYGCVYQMASGFASSPVFVVSLVLGFEVGDTVRPIFLSLVIFALVGFPSTDTPKGPFSLAVVPTSSHSERGSITMAQNCSRYEVTDWSGLCVLEVRRALGAAWECKTQLLV
jgi:hypothetical protein